MRPGHNRVIALQPEFITPQDGHDKQDCENAAAKRWINKYGEFYSKYVVTVLGDDLYSREPICRLLLDKGLNFILVCKPDSHKELYEWVGELDALGEVQTVTIARRKGKCKEIDKYRYVNDVPLRGGEVALRVNWCEITTESDNGKIIYHNAFVTHHRINEDNVAAIVSAGRVRWKIENENNNVLKNNGYHLEHNFGHGAKHLSSLLFTLNLLAFLFHTVLEISDERYRAIRNTLPTRKSFFNDLRALTIYMYFRNWDSLMNFMIKSLELEFHDTS